MSKTIIRWASHTRNYYTWSCNKVSPGCTNCYMMAQAERYGQNPHGAPAFRANVWKEKTQPGAVYFVNSMSDTYHEGVPLQWIHAIHNDALVHPEATFLVLTKRIERAFYLSPYLAWPQNLWIGTSVENEDYLWRLDYLLEIPAAGHFVSLEPLLGSVTKRQSPGHRYRGIEEYLYLDCKAEQFLPIIRRDYRTFGIPEMRAARLRKNRLGWVIVGGESGGNRRLFDKQWAREIRDLCVEADVPFMFKQGSAYKSEQDYLLDDQEWSQSPFFVVEQKAAAVQKPEQLRMF